MFRSILIALVVFSFALGVVPNAHAGRAQLGGPVETTDQAYVDLRTTIQGGDIDSRAKSELLALADNAYASRSSYEDFLAATNSFAATLIESGADAAYTGAVLDGYSEALQAEEIEYDIVPHFFKKCDAQFNCGKPGNICVIISWSDPNGSGGSNCISPTIR